MADLDPTFEPDVTSDASDAPEDLTADTADAAVDEPETADEDGSATSDEPSLEDEEGGEPTAAGRSEKLDNLLKKYGGDPDKLVDAYWNQANSMSSLAKKLDAIEAHLTAQQAPPVDEAKLIAEDPEVKEIAGELAFLDGQVKDTNKTEQALIGEYGRLERVLAELQGELRLADDLSKSEVNQRVREVQNDMRQMQREYRENSRLRATLEAQMRGVARQFRQVEAMARARQGQIKQQEFGARIAAQATRDEFAGSVRAEATKYGIDTSSKTYGLLQTTVKDRLTGYLRSLPANAPGIDIPAAVAQLMAEYTEAMGLKKSFQKKSAEKTSLSSGAGVTGRSPLKPGTRPGAPAPTDKTGKYWSVDYVRKRADKLLGVSR